MSAMKKILKILGIVLIVLLLGAATVWFLFLKPIPPPISDNDRARLQVMPLPSELEFGNGSILITENFGIHFEKDPNPKIEKAIERFYKELTLKTGLSFVERSGKELQIKNPKVIEVKDYIYIICIVVLMQGLLRDGYSPSIIEFK